jgi:hypothetical protein
MRIIKAETDSPETASQPTETLTPRWISGPVMDTVMTFSWVPFALLAMVNLDKPANLKGLMFYVFLFSFMHQPLSLFLVYGDRERFDMRRQLFIWSPLIFGIAIFAALQVSPLVLALVAGAWNVEHTLMQRYGITRIYGRMAGQQHGGMELPMLLSWLLVAAAWAAADPNTMERVASLGIRGANRSAFEIFAGWQTTAEALLAPVAALAVILSGKWLLEESRRTRNPAKHRYLASTLALFAVMMVNPIMGFMGYVGADSFEYFVIVHRAIDKGYIEPRRMDSALGRAANGSLGRSGLLAGYIALIISTIYLLENHASYLVYSMIFFTLGALHFFYDGFIWKLRNPQVARSVGAVS